MSDTINQPNPIAPIPSKGFDEVVDGASAVKQRKRSRWDEVKVETSLSAIVTNANDVKASLVDKKSKALALQASIAARLNALKAKQPSTVSAGLIPNSSVTGLNSSTKIEDPSLPSAKRAKVYDWDISITTPLSRQKELEEIEKSKQPTNKKSKNPYLSHLESKQTADDELEVTDNQSGKDTVESDSRLDGVRIIKKRIRNKVFNSIEPGTFQALAERKRLRQANAIQSGFVSGRKIGNFIKATGIATTSSIDLEAGNLDVHRIAPRADAPEESMDGSTATSGGVVVIPLPIVMEWWDVELLPGKLKKELAAREGQALMESLTYKSSTKKKIPIDSSSTEVRTYQKEDDEGTKGGNEVTSSDLTLSDDVQEDENLTRLRNKCYLAASILNAKTSPLIQHPVPVIPSHLRGKEEGKVSNPTLYLTKRERKRQRKLRRAQHQRELQDMQAVGLIPPPEPRLTLSNFIKVLGDQAILDPSKMEAKVLEQMQARKLKHETTNQERMLTDEQRKAKKAKKLTKDDAITSAVVTVALFLVKDMSHRYHRTKVDLNAQQNQITGGVLECGSPEFSLVICEGTSRAIRRYTRLMLERMRWKGENMLDREDSDEDNDRNHVVDDTNSSNIDEPKQKFNPDNFCRLIWTGMAPKRIFNSFAFQSCANAEAARKVLEAKGVAHFWDQVLVHANGMGETFNVRLGN